MGKKEGATLLPYMMSTMTGDDDGSIPFFLLEKKVLDFRVEREPDATSRACHVCYSMVLSCTRISLNTNSPLCYVLISKRLEIPMLVRLF